MRLIDADELIKQGWVLTRHGVSNCLIGVKSIADVPTAFDPDNVLKQLDELNNTVLKVELSEKKDLEDETDWVLTILERLEREIKELEGN